jgi:hypothetical protein
MLSLASLIPTILMKNYLHLFQVLVMIHRENLHGRLVDHHIPLLNNFYTFIFTLIYNFYLDDDDKTRGCVLKNIHAYLVSCRFRQYSTNMDK